MTEPVIMTDPAREIVELCEAISTVIDSSKSGEWHLARRFQVEAWSREFFEIVFTISERIELLANIIDTLDLDDDYRGEIISHVRDILDAFSARTLRQTWNNVGSVKVGSENIQPLKAVTGLVRSKIRYKKLSEDEVSSVLQQVSELLEWLNDHRLVENDFIRAALIEGLGRFSFRLKKLKWLGWGYTLDSLRDVIAAYMLLERSGVTAEINPDAEAVLKKVAALLHNVYQKVQVAKGAVESGDFLLRAYGLGALWYQGQPVVAGLLGNG